MTIMLQWSPVLETGNTFRRCWTAWWKHRMLQWSPVLETGNTRPRISLERTTTMLQWSPVLETGNTAALRGERDPIERAAMEPGFRDREYGPGPRRRARGALRCNGARF